MRETVQQNRFFVYPGSLVLFMAVVLTIFSACATLKPASPPEDLSRLYVNAVQDAENPQPHEISKNLTAIAASNQNLLWRDTPGISPVLVVTWTSYEGYDGKAGENNTVPEVWVTVVPELKQFCKERNLPYNALALRIEQLLGLPPGSGKSRFVEMWANPRDLFRPCPDDEITDTRCGLNLPEKASPAHREWFNLKRAASYCKCEKPLKQAYPWTQLGYTYDWGNSESETGLSEFVIRKGSTVVINSVSTLDQYCGSK
jgi:hypothetical protein